MDGDALDCGCFQDGLHFLKSGTGIVIRLERRAATVYAASAAGQAWRMGFPGFFTALGTRAASGGGVAKMPAFLHLKGLGIDCLTLYLITAIFTLSGIGEEKVRITFSEKISG